MGKDPALIAYNDSQFQEEDWKAIQTIHKSSKREDTSYDRLLPQSVIVNFNFFSKIGKYGVGFRACYHVRWPILLVATYSETHIGHG